MTSDLPIPASCRAARAGVAKCSRGIENLLSSRGCTQDDSSVSISILRKSQQFCHPERSEGSFYSLKAKAGVVDKGARAEIGPFPFFFQLFNGSRSARRNALWRLLP